MPKKRYICSRYPRLKLLGGIEFVDGRFDTDNPLVQQRIESNDLFGASIRCILLSEVEEAVKAAPVEERPTESFNVDFEAEEDDGEWAQLPPVDAVEEGGASPPSVSRTDVNKLNRAKLCEFAADLGVEDIEEKSMVKLRFEVFKKLGI